MPRPVSESMLRTIVAQALSDAERPRLIAVAAPPRWDGPDELETEAGPVSVRACVSSLAVREVLAGMPPNGGQPVVILTDLDEAELGTEVIARLWGHRVRRPHGLQALQQQFRATDIDPALNAHRWLVDQLVAIAPVAGYAPPKSGLLDLDTAWQTYLRHALRIDAERPGLGELLRWGELESSRTALTGVVKPHLDQVAQRFGGSVGAVARHIFKLVADGRGSDLVPIGLICDVLWSDAVAEDKPLITARVRVEALLGEKGLTAQAARAWGGAAVSLVRRAQKLSDDATRTRWVNRAEAILGGELDALPFAHASSVLPRGFEQRLEHAGRTLLDVLQRPTDPRKAALRAAVHRADEHLRSASPTEGERIEGLRMAERLTRRWGQADTPEHKDLADAARAYAADGAWVDRAREALGRGETVDSLAKAYTRILERLDIERSERDRAFASLLASWSKIEPGDRPPLLPVERVLDTVVVPLAKEAPVLMIVLDGWSHALAPRLLEDLAQQGWERFGPGEAEHPVVVSALPSVTRVSRASLLTGTLTQGSQAVERAGWEEHAGLLGVSTRKPAALFHKADLSTLEGQQTGEVTKAVLDPDVQVVGVVVNAIDEHLDKGGQLRLAEGLQALRPMRPLLEAAAESGRVVILVSDHGHVLETGSKVAKHEGASERWRGVHPPAQDGEMELRGPRVLMDDGKIVVPTTEGLRYMSAKKHGYHGGATPQEVLCPLAVLALPGTTLSAWEPLPSLQPWWWREEGGPVAPALAPAGARHVTERPPAVDAKDQVHLFADLEPEAADADQSESAALPAWLGGLLDSPILSSQRAAAGRQALGDEDVAALLLALDASGGVAGLNVLANYLDISVSRASTKTEALRRLLNIDGFGVIEMEGGGTVRFQRDILVSQFGLDA